MVATAVVIPFRWTPGQIEVEVAVNGAPARWFVADTGAEYSVLQADYAASLGLRTAPRLGREFASGVSLRVGAIELRNQDVMVMSLDNFRQQRRPIVGLLGHDFFAAHVVEIDYRARTLTAHHREAFQAPSAATAVPLSFAGRLPVAPLTIRFPGRPAVTARMAVDTGASQPVVLRHPFAQAHGLLERARQRPATRAGSAECGAVEFLRVPAEEVVFGSSRIGGLVLWIYPDAIGAGAATETDGVVGNEILSRFRVTLDYSRRVMYLN